MPQSDGLHLGVVGVGRIGLFHARTLLGLDGVERLTIADADSARAKQVAADLGAHAANTPEALVEAGVDALVIATSTPGHAPLLALAARAGLPAFCEKPIALDLEATADVVKHVERSGIPFQMGFQRRFDRGYLAARDLACGGGLGDLYAIRMAGHDPAPPPEAYIPVSGGIFRDFSVHDFDALRFVTDQEVVSVYAEGEVVGFPVFAKYNDVDTAAVLLRLSSGALGVLTATRHDPLGYDIRMELIGSKDSVAVGMDERMPLRSVEPGVAPPKDPYRDFQDRFADAYRAEMVHFVQLAQGRLESPCTARDALEALRIAVACDRSRAERRPVLLEEIA